MNNENSNVGDGREHRLARRAILKSGVATIGLVGLEGSRRQGMLVRSATAAAAPAPGDVPTTQKTKLLPKRSLETSGFGSEVTLDGDTLFIGSSTASASEFESGEAHVFTGSGDSWTQQARLEPDDVSGSDYFGGAVAVADDTALIGAAGVQIKEEDAEDALDTEEQGAVYAFTRSNENWTQQTRLIGDRTATNFGESVALDGGTALFGSPGDADPNDSTVRQGAAYAYTGSGGSWSQQERIALNNPVDGDEFGWSVALDGDTALIGAPYLPDYIYQEDGGVGSAYVFTHSNMGWTQQTEFTGDNGGVKEDEFGYSVALEGDTALISAPNDDKNQGDESVYVFARSGGSWNQTEKLVATDGESGDDFGNSVVLNGDVAIVGAPFSENQNDNTLGAAYVFTRSDGSWKQKEKLTAADASDQFDARQFGDGVALDDGTAVIGDPGDNRDEDTSDTVIRAGSAYVFGPSLVFSIEVPSPDSNPFEETTFEVSQPADSDVTYETYEWDLDNDGEFEENGKTVSTTFETGGEKTVTLRVTTESGETATTSRTIQVNRRPKASFTVPEVPNEAEPAIFDATGSSDQNGSVVKYHWEFGDGSTTTTKDPVVEHTYEIGDYGNQDVSLSVTDDNGATSDEVTKTVRVNAVPRAEFEVTTDPPVRNEPVEFDASTSTDRDDPKFEGEIETYKWDFDDGTTEKTDEPVIEHTYTTGGQKNVTVRVTDNDDASNDDLSVDSDSITVRIRVDVDIKPDTNQNSVNPKKKGTLPVAVVQTSEFDPPRNLDPASVHFGNPDDIGFDTSTDQFTPQGGATPAHDGGHVEDVNDDGDDDLMFHFSVLDADFDSNDTEGELVGLTTDDVPVFGTDSVKIVGGGGGPP